MDRYLVHGEEYKAVRDAMAKAVLECKTLDIGNALMVRWVWASLCSQEALPGACIFPSAHQMMERANEELSKVTLY